MPRPALPKVPTPRIAALVRAPTRERVAGDLLPRGVHLAARTQWLGGGASARGVRAAV